MVPKLCAFIVLLLVDTGVGVIHSLNATEYSRMPPVFAILDEYEPCMEQPGAVYCIIKLDLYAEPGNSLMHTIHEYSNDKNRHYNHTNIDRGLCVRSRCGQYLEGDTETDITRAVERCMNDSIHNHYGVNAKLALVFHCDYAGERDPKTPSDWAFLAVISALVTAALVATVYHRYLKKWKREDKGNPIILSFSLIRNWQWLTESNMEDQRMKSLKAFHGVRVVINFLMITVHVAFFYAGGFQTNTYFIEKSYDNPFSYLFYNGLVIVQIFFFISGFLLAYNLEIYAETRQITLKMLPFIMFKRIMRLTPALGMMIWFTSTWLRHLGNGPLWKLHINNSVVSDCHKYWWTHLLYINNYFPDNKSCAIQTWHIAADTQLFLLGLVVLISTMKKGRWRTLTSLLILGTVAPALQVWLYDHDALVLLTPELFRTLNTDTFFRFHVVGTNNIQTFVMGLAAARLVYKYQLQGKDFSKWKWYARSHIFTIPAYALFFYLAHVFYEGETSLVTRIVYASVQRLLMGILTMWLILGFVLKVPSGFRIFAESKAWIVPSRLTYSVYLVHMNLVHLVLGARRHTSEVNVLNLTVLYFGIVMISYLLALPFFLLVEAPFNGLCKLLTSENKVKGSAVETTETNKHVVESNGKEVEETSKNK